MKAARAARLLLLAAGCGAQPRTPAGVPPALVVEPACARPLSAGELGFSLAGASPAVPRHPAGIERFIAERHDGRPAVVPGPPLAARTFDWASVAGAPACGAPVERVTVEGEPPRLAVMRPTPVAIERIERGSARLAGGEAPEARSEWAAAAAIEPWWTEPVALAGDGYMTEERWDEAASIYGRVTATAPWNGSAHGRRGRALLRGGRRADGLAAFRVALALAPADATLPPLLREAGAHVIEPVLPPAEREAATDATRWMVRPDGTGDLATRMAEATAYATCKEAFRQSEAVRRDAAGLTGPGWRWSVAEEDLCTVLWLGAYAHHRNAGRPPDPAIESLLDVVARGALSERSLFDVGARAHPHAPLLLRVPQRNRLIEFVARHRAPDRPGRGWLAP